MLSFLTSRLTGAAAKAGVAALQGFIGVSGAVIGTEQITGSDTGLTLLGYVIIGALGGAANWAGVYFKKNPGYVPPRSDGLY